MPIPTATIGPLGSCGCQDGAYSPQQTTQRSASRSAQLLKVPAATATNEPAGGSGWTLYLLPQHSSESSARSTQACAPPTANDV